MMRVRKLVRPARVPCGTSRRRRGLTLLEVILALALSAVVLVMVGASVRLHLRMFETRRLGLEQAEVARALFRQISRELRSAVVADPLSAVSATGDAASTEADPNATSDATQAVDPMQQTAIGLYGTLTQLRFDSSVALRPANLWLAADVPETADLASLPFASPRSELRTIRYFLANGLGAPSVGAGTASIMSAPGATAAIGGLMRSSSDQSLFAFEVVNGGGNRLVEEATLLAPEVVDVSFRYFDGLQWLDQWDSASQQGLPVAVEVTLVMQDPLAAAEEEDAFWGLSAGSANRQPESVIYQRVIYLPVALPTNQVEAVNG